jgi:hypothetical protein
MSLAPFGPDREGYLTFPCLNRTKWHHCSAIPGLFADRDVCVSDGHDSLTARHNHWWRRFPLADVVLNKGKSIQWRMLGGKK